MKEKETKIGTSWGPIKMAPPRGIKIIERLGTRRRHMKRRHNDIPVSIYFFRSPAFLMYFYDGPCHLILHYFVTKDT